jgi:hypothetical protein
MYKCVCRGGGFVLKTIQAVPRDLLIHKRIFSWNYILKVVCFLKRHFLIRNMHFFEKSLYQKHLRQIKQIIYLWFSGFFRTALKKGFVL